MMTVGSREVAQDFGKRHSDLLDKIAILEADIKENRSTEYMDEQNKPRKEYLLTRDGFSLVVMGFTGKKALEWKLKYIKAFNKMEETLKQIVDKNTSLTVT